jgi:hypothetical protein
MATTKPSGKVKANVAVGVIVDAKPPVYRTTIVRDRHTGKLVEVALTEFEPIDPGSEGRFYVFKQGEEVSAEHEAVLTSPGSFSPVEG